MRFKNLAATSLTIGRSRYPLGEFEIEEPFSESVENDVEAFIQKGLLEKVTASAAPKKPAQAAKPTTKTKPAKSAKPSGEDTKAPVEDTTDKPVNKETKKPEVA